MKSYTDNDFYIGDYVIFAKSISQHIYARIKNITISNKTLCFELEDIVSNDLIYTCENVRPIFTNSDYLLALGFKEKSSYFTLGVHTIYKENGGIPGYYLETFNQYNIDKSLSLFNINMLFEVLDILHFKYDPKLIFKINS
jgi:hypothetical protein